MEIIKNVLVGLIFQGVVGFFAWTFWQIAAAGIPALPSIPLSAGVALWMLWFMMLYVPLFLAVFAVLKSLTPTTTVKNNNPTT